MDGSPPDSSVHGILQAKILEWVAWPPTGDLPDPGIELSSLMSLSLTGGFFTSSVTWETLIHPYLLSTRRVFSHKRMLRNMQITVIFKTDFSHCAEASGPSYLINTSRFFKFCH